MYPNIRATYEATVIKTVVFSKGHRQKDGRTVYDIVRWFTKSVKKLHIK